MIINEVKKKTYFSFSFEITVKDTRKLEGKKEGKKGSFHFLTFCSLAQIIVVILK